MKFTFAKVAGVLLIGVFGVSAASAAPTYRWEFSGTGDTVGIGGLADNGDILQVGFGDSCGRSAVNKYDPISGTYSGRQFVVSFANGLDARDCGVAVSRFNSAGDMVGTTLRGGVSIPTFWRGGVAYDLRDAANAGLVFTPDAQAVSALGTDLSTLDILAPHPFIRAGSDFYLKALLTNGLGMFAAESMTFGGTGFVLIPVTTAAVAEPHSGVLVLAALAAAAVSRRQLRSKDTQELPEAS
jgi:hypothetical protein